MLIVFEGLDGAGKTTQAAMLTEKLRERGVSALSLREPGGTTLSDQIRPIVKGLDVPLCDMARFHLFMAARSQLADEVIRPALDRGAVVVLDRYIESTYAYQCYGAGVVDRDTLSLLCRGLPVPDVVLLLDIPVDVSIERLRGGPGDAYESRGTEFIKRVAYGYDVMHSRLTPLTLRVDATRSVEAVHLDVLHHVHKAFSDKLVPLL